MVLVVAREGVGVEVWAETQKFFIAKTLNWDRQKKTPVCDSELLSEECFF